jgi:hypothetical protein
MKIQIVQAGSKKLSSKHACPWYVDEPGTPAK